MREGRGRGEEGRGVWSDGWMDGWVGEDVVVVVVVMMVKERRR